MRFCEVSAVSRFWTGFLRGRVQELSECEERRSELLKEAMRRLFVSFAADFSLWMQAVHTIAELDCLTSLALYSSHAEGEALGEKECLFIFDWLDSFLVDTGPMCRPEFLDIREGPQFELRGGWHPAVAANHRTSLSQFIPNDVVLGRSENSARFVLVTGACIYFFNCRAS